MSSESNPGSFLEPRPPILNPWNRQFLRPTEVKKNLVYHMGESDEEEYDDTIKVYLRIKPGIENAESTLEILNSRTVQTNIPQNVIKKKKIMKTDRCKYIFTKILPPTTTQQELFGTFVEKSVEEFIFGKDNLLFSYGTSNSGKTFTVQGSTENPGIIPRVIAMVFKNLTTNRLQNNSKLYPCTKNLVAELSAKDFDELTDLKYKIFTKNAEKNSNDTACSSKSKLTGCSVDFIGNASYKEMQSKLESEVPQSCPLEEGAVFSLWVSFTEIYNEALYDLLQLPDEKRKRTQLKLVQDHMKTVYVKGLKHINVASAAEAYQVLQFGRNNLCFARTGMNDTSSRSHCIFTIKLIKFQDPEDVESVSISSFSICDLAGAERQRNALNVGDRLRESQNINCSLHVLSRCFQIIRENQIKNEKQRIPYRDSKLTQLFQNALNGKENITMIINANPSPELYEETHHVLKASAIAKQIVYENKPKTSQIRLSRFSLIVSAHKGNASIPWESGPPAPTEALTPAVEIVEEANESNSVETDDEYIEYLLSFVESLQEKLKAERLKTRELKQKNLTLETNLREELTDKFFKILKEKKEKHERDIQDTEKFLLKMENQKIARIRKQYEDQINEMKRKLNFFNTSAELSAINNYNDEEVQDLKEQVKELTSQVNGLTEMVNITKKEKCQEVTKSSTLSMQLNLLTSDNEKLKQALEAAKSNSNESLIAELQKVRLEFEEKIKLRDEYLEEARQDIEYEKREKVKLEEQVATLEMEVIEKEQKIEDLESEINSLRDLLALKADEIERLELEEVAQKDCALELEQAKGVLCQKDEVITDLENRLQEEIAKLNDLKTVQSNLAEEASSWKDKCCQQERKLEEVQKGHNDELTSKIEYIKTLEEQLSASSKQYDELKEAHTKLQDKTCDLCEQTRKQYEQHLAERNSEISTLEKSIKKGLQKQCNLEKDIQYKNDEISGLQSKLKETVKALETEKALFEDASQNCCRHDQEIENLKSKLVAYENTANVMTSYCEEVKKKDAELVELRRQVQEQSIVIQNQDREHETFQANQKTIVAKYEELLKKRKEEVEREKREAASLSNTLYKSTPTPKKDLQGEVEKLKQELAEKQSKIDRMTEQLSKDASKENEVPKRLTRAKSKANKSEYVFGEDSEDDVFVSNERKLRAKSTAPPLSSRKTRGQRLKEAASSNVPDIYLNKDDSQIKLPVKGTRRKLYDAAEDTTSAFDSFEMEQTKQESPRSAIKNSLQKCPKSLRPRKKD